MASAATEVEELSFRGVWGRSCMMYPFPAFVSAVGGRYEGGIGWGVPCPCHWSGALALY